MNEKAVVRQPQDKFIVRFPDGMRDQIAKAAEANGRSMNAEIVQRIEQTFSPGEGADARRFIQGIRQMADDLMELIDQASFTAEIDAFMDGLPEDEIAAKKLIQTIKQIPNFLRTPEQRFVVDVIRLWPSADRKLSTSDAVELLKRARTTFALDGTPENVIAAMKKRQARKQE